MQTLRQDNIPKMIVSGATSVLLDTVNGGQSTAITVGGQQYIPASLLTLNGATVGANGLDAGSLGASQLWYVYAIVHQTSFAVALVASLTNQISGPTMPTGYGTAFKLIGAFNTNPSSQISSTITPSDGIVSIVNPAFVGGPTTMDDATATMLGLKTYHAGTAYKSGIVPTLSTSLTIDAATSYGRMVPYQTSNGAWRMKFNFRINNTAGSGGGISFFLSGITYISLFSQAVVCYPLATAVLNYSYADAGTNGVFISFNTGSAAGFLMSGDVELTSKPTWAY